MLINSHTTDSILSVLKQLGCGDHLVRTLLGLSFVQGGQKREWLGFKKTLDSDVFNWQLLAMEHRQVVSDDVHANFFILLGQYKEFKTTNIKF
jgi:hypothetical protein